MSFAPLWKLHEQFGRQLLERLQQDLEGMAESAAKPSREQQLQRFLAIINCYVNLIRSMARGAPEVLGTPGSACVSHLPASILPCVCLSVTPAACCSTAVIPGNEQLY